MRDLDDLPATGDFMLELRSRLGAFLATPRRHNAVEARSFAEMLEQTIRRYQNRTIEATQGGDPTVGRGS